MMLLPRRTGLAMRRLRNELSRLRGEEPYPNPKDHGIKRMMRFLKRHGVSPVNTNAEKN
jgi:hypothetical protein